jgi:hypothetical protein
VYRVFTSTKMSAQQPIACTVLPKILEFHDTTHELYPDLHPSAWEGHVERETTVLADTSSYRTILHSIVSALTFMDRQYYDRLTRSNYLYDASDCRIIEVFRFESFRTMLEYNVFAVSDTLNNGFFCFTTYNQFGMRPLFKEYELLLIDRLLVDTPNKHYFKPPFLMAVQRTCYMWLQKSLSVFELRGEVGMPILWAHSKPRRDHYDMFCAWVWMQFDMAECVRSGDIITSKISIKLTMPTDLERSTLPKSDFKGDEDFHDQLWARRISIIEEKIGQKYTLKCDEEISDIK